MLKNHTFFSVARMAKVLKVSESGYYKWIARKELIDEAKAEEEALLKEEIKSIFLKSKGSLGRKKLTKVLNQDRSKPVNHKRVERIMHNEHWISRVTRKYICTTNSDHDNPIADNLISRDFHALRPNEKMVSDTTVISTKQGNLYVAGILDLFGRLPVGLAMSKNNDKYLVIEAFQDMITNGKGSKGCIIHSDRGSTYTSNDYRKLIDEHEFICSMSRKGDCWDNAPMESFWGKMKLEWLKDKYDTIAEAKRDVYEYVWSFYPCERPHESNNYLTPMEYYGRYKNGHN